MSALVEPAPLSDVVDLLLADVAVRIQLSPTKYLLAVQRYLSISDWLDRADSPLHGRVDLVYPQGSMAIGATTSAVQDEDYDIDLIAQLRLPQQMPPHEVLNLLDAAVRGAKGSRYFEMTYRHTRCVQVRYGNEMHLDITPMVRRPVSPEREGWLFHSPKSLPTLDDATLLANPYGFAQWFAKMTPAQRDFAKAFAARERLYEAMTQVAKADAEPVPEQEPVEDKSMAVIALQLIKRWRVLRYTERAGRCPASVLLACFVAEAAGNTRSLSEELLYQARYAYERIAQAHRVGQLINVHNPVCQADDFTDRWPANLPQQAVFLNDLTDLIAKLERLRAGCSLPTMRAILADLFGEKPTGDAIQEFNRALGNTVTTGQSHHRPQGGRFDLAASGVIATAAATTPSIVRATPAHTHFGASHRRR
jgi:hypothetical protein